MIPRWSNESRCYVVTGALGGAKEIGASLAARLGYFHMDGDLYHSRRSIKKIASGIALNEHELVDWLTTLSGELAAARAESWPVVLSCSAPRRIHRDILRKGNPGLVFVHVAGHCGGTDDRVKHGETPAMHQHLSGVV
jgi:gluconokinase